MILNALTSLAAALTFVLAALAAPTPLSARAGAPIGKPVDNCTITSVFPSYDGWGLGFWPDPDFVSANLLYSYVLNEDNQLTSSEQVLLTNCLETCNGYGNPGDCQSVFLAYNFPDVGTGMALGTAAPTGQQVGCALFSQQLTEDDFAPPTVSRTYTFPKAANLMCPAS